MATCINIALTKNYKLMDLIDAFNLWKELGYELNSFTDEDTNNYIIQFIKDNEIKGTITTIPGQGIRWEFPQELLDYNNAKERANELAQASAEIFDNLEN